MAGNSPLPTVDEWLLDDGASVDICPPGQFGLRSRLESPELMSTANGVISSEAKITVALDAFNEEADCIEMDTAVGALSLYRSLLHDSWVPLLMGTVGGGAHVANP